MRRMFKRMLLGALAWPAMAMAQTPSLSVRDAIFPYEVDAAADYRLIEPMDEEHRPIFVMLGDSAVTDASLSEHGRGYMLARDAFFLAVRPEAVKETRPLHLIVEGELPCRLQAINQLIIVSGAPEVAPSDALQAEGCPTPSAFYAARVVLGRFEQALWIKAAPIRYESALALQDIPKGISPDSPLAKVVIPEMNRQRIAEHDAAMRDDERSRAATAAAAMAHGGIVDDDERLRVFVAAAAADARTRDFKPDLFIVAGQPFVHFSDGYGRSFLMSFDGNGKTRIDGL